MSSVNLSRASTVVSARILDLLIHEGLENSIALGLPALLCQVGVQHERVISLSRGAVHRKREVLDSSPFSKHRGGHSLASPRLSLFLCLLSYAFWSQTLVMLLFLLMLDYLIWIQVSWCLALRENEREVIGGFARKGDQFQKGPLWIFCAPYNKEGT